MLLGGRTNQTVEYVIYLFRSRAMHIEPDSGLNGPCHFSVFLQTGMLHNFERNMIEASEQLPDKLYFCHEELQPGGASEALIAYKAKQIKRERKTSKK